MVTSRAIFYSLGVLNCSAGRRLPNEQFREQAFVGCCDAPSGSKTASRTPSDHAEAREHDSPGFWLGNGARH